MEHLKYFYKNKNVLVTGGAGFIGSHIAQNLCSLEANVTILDDLSTGSLDNIKPFCKNMKMVASDITIFKSCLKATKKQDIVFHTAAFISVPESVKHPKLCEKINVEGTKNLLEACRINKVKTCIFSSSAAVYGERKEECKESDTPKPQSPYAQSKLDGEILCKEYAKNYGVNTASLRYFNVYGERQNPNGAYAGVAAKFKQNIINNETITIYGNGKQKRDFINVSQVAMANLLIGSKAVLRGDIYNIATGKSITLFELIKKLEKETKRKHTKIAFEPSRKGDIFSSRANCDKFLFLKEDSKYEQKNNSTNTFISSNSSKTG